MGSKPILTPDTSGINRLADDPDSDALVAGLRSGFHVRLTFTSVSEVIANNNRARRAQLLRICRLLLSSGDCIDPQHEIIRKMVTRFEESLSFNWRMVRVDFPEAENEIAREENFSDDLAEQEREEARALHNQFVKVYDDAKPAFDKLFKNGTKKTPVNVSQLVARLQMPGGAFWTLAGGLYSRVGKLPPDETTIRKFSEGCDPFRALMIALCAAQYDRCIRPQDVGPSLRSGRNDTLMAVCLPYCHQFVTADPRQLACYKEVVSVAGLDVTVNSYEEFRNGFLVIGAPAGSEGSTIRKCLDAPPSGRKPQSVKIRADNRGAFVNHLGSCSFRKASDNMALLPGFSMRRNWGKS